MRWLLIALLALSVQAHARLFDSSELESLASPLALHPDPVVWAVLDASLAPHDAPRMLAAYPDISAHMARNPQWIFDLGQAYGAQRNELVVALQTLRQRANVPPQYIVVQPPPALIIHPPVIVHPSHGHGHRPHRPPHAHRDRNGPPSPAVQLQREQARQYREHHHVPESRRRPIVDPQTGARFPLR
jgi:hypothetical protein